MTDRPTQSEDNFSACGNLLVVFPVVIVVYDVVGGQLGVVSGEAFQIESRGAEDEIDLRNNKGKKLCVKSGEETHFRRPFFHGCIEGGNEKVFRAKSEGVVVFPISRGRNLCRLQLAFR